VALAYSSGCIGFGRTTSTPIPSQNNKWSNDHELAARLFPYLDAALPRVHCGGRRVLLFGYKAEFERVSVWKKIPADYVLMLPVNCTGVRGKEGVDYTLKEELCWYEEPKFRVN
jgi:hypothetical protein